MIVAVRYIHKSNSVLQILDRRAVVNAGSDGLGIVGAKRSGDNAAGEESFFAMAMRTRTVLKAIDIMGVI